MSDAGSLHATISSLISSQAVWLCTRALKTFVLLSRWIFIILVILWFFPRTSLQAWHLWFCVIHLSSNRVDFQEIWYTALIRRNCDHIVHTDFLLCGITVLQKKKKIFGFTKIHEWISLKQQYYLSRLIYHAQTLHMYLAFGLNTSKVSSLKHVHTGFTSFKLDKVRIRFCHFSPPLPLEMTAAVSHSTYMKTCEFIHLHCLHHIISTCIRQGPKQLADRPCHYVLPLNLPQRGQTLCTLPVCW